MAIFQQEPPMTNVGQDACQVWLVIDDRGTPTNFNRWRLSQVHASNAGTLIYEGQPATFYWYVQDPAAPFTNFYYDSIGPGEDRFYDIPAQFKNVDPWTFNWGSGQGTKPPWAP